MTRFYLDHNVSGPFLRLARARGYDIIVAEELGLAGAKDEEQLLTAAQMGRLFITHDIDDIMMLHRAWHRWSSVWQVEPRHSGVLIIPQQPHWSAQRALKELEDFLAVDPPLANELYQWHASGGWHRYARLNDGRWRFARV